MIISRNSKYVDHSPSSERAFARAGGLYHSSFRPTQRPPFLGRRCPPTSRPLRWRAHGRMTHPMKATNVPRGAECSVAICAGGELGLESYARGMEHGMRQLGHASGGRACLHERSQIADSYFHSGGYSTEESRRIFCDVCRMQRWLEIEAALALSQSDLGMIPEDVAHRIAQHARIELIDLEEVRRGIAETGHSLVPLLRGLERSCGGYAGQFVHHGATTQDIQDTGMSLEMRDVLERVDHDLSRLMAGLGAIAREHRDQVMMGRTHAQPALPTTFGLKVAGWIDELLRHRERIAEARPRVLVAQLFGGVGT